MVCPGRFRTCFENRVFRNQYIRYRPGKLSGNSSEATTKAYLDKFEQTGLDTTFKHLLYQEELLIAEPFQVFRNPGT